MKEIKGDECYTSLDIDDTKYTLFYFTASWCGPCQKILPEIIKLEKLISDYVNFYKIDVDEDENNELCEKCKILTVPSFLLFKQRTCVDRTSGANIENIKDMIKNNIKNKDS